MRVSDATVCDRCERCRSTDLRDTLSGYTCIKCKHKGAKPFYGARNEAVPTRDAALVAQKVTVGRGARW